MVLLTWFFCSGPKISYASKQIIKEVINNDLPELIEGETGIITNNGYQIWYECKTPDINTYETVLFIFGAGGSALEWPPSFLKKFINNGFQIIRYDQRDTGFSKPLVFDNQIYTLDDLGKDVVAIMDKRAIEKAHIIGLSMGGMVAQEIAIQFPSRVKSLTLIMTSGDVTASDLPSMTSLHFFGRFARGLPLLRYRLFGGELNLVKERIAGLMLHMNESDINVKETAEMVLYDLRNRAGVNIKTSIKHQKIVAKSVPRYTRIENINIPTLVVHGTKDTLIPIEHGKKLAEKIKGSSVLWLDGIGHMFPLPDMENFCMKLIEFLKEVKK